MFSTIFKMGAQPRLTKLGYSLITAIGFLVVLSCWFLISVFEIIPNNILPNPVKVLLSYGNLIFEDGMFINAGYSIYMNLVSYVYALLIAVPLGFLIALFPINNILFGKNINSVRYLPVPAISGIFISIFGLTFGMKTAFLSFALFIYILPAVVNKVNELQNPANDKNYVYLQTIETLGASNWQKFRYVYVPYVMREISQEIINLTAISWSYICITELLYKSGSVSGIGAMINTMVRQSRISEAYALLFVVIIIGILQDAALKKLDKLVFPSKYNIK